MLQKLAMLWKDEEGATAVEYGILVALIAVGIIAAVTGARDALIARFDAVTSALNGL